MKLSITIKKAIRHLIRNKTNSLLNIIGLTVGFICVFCIASYVLHEYSFDQNHPDKENTYRIISNDVNTGTKDKMQSAMTYLPVRKFILEEIPEVKDIVRVKAYQQITVGNENELSIEKGFIWSDAGILNIFDIQLIEGHKKTALEAPGSVIIAKTAAKKYFGTTNIINRTIQVDKETLTITGVFDDIPSNNHLQFTMVGAIQTLKNLEDPWSQQGHLYLSLSKNSDPLQVVKKINTSIKSKIWWVSEAPVFSLQPLQDIHLYSSNILVSPNSIDIRYLYLFAVIGLVIVLSTTFNCISLSIADIYNRKQNIGISKILGSSKLESIIQPVTECAILCFISAISAILFSLILIDDINQVMESSLSAAFLISTNNLLILAGLTFIVILISSAYPALLVSKFKPISLVNKQITPAKTKLVFRKPLMVIQNAIVIILLMVVIVVNKQMKHLGNDRLGFNKEQVIILKSPNFRQANTELTKQQIINLKEVSSASISMSTPLGGGISFFVDNIESPYYRSDFTVDQDYIQTLGMNIISGRDFTGTDTNSIIVNEAMVLAKNWQEPLGQKIDFFGTEREVIGVVQNFQMSNIRSEINPAVLGLGSQYKSNILVRMHPLNVESGIEKIQKIWSEINPAQPMTYSFLDTDFETLFKSEVKFQRLSKIFTGVAIIITCLGLYAAILYAVQRRVKEIGIRKVLGASGNTIVSLLLKEYVMILFIAFIIAIPVSWWLMSKWLEDFAYKIPIEWWMFAVAGLAAFTIIMITTGYQAIKSALINPVKSLRSE
ncbi:ABC transporter permease [Gynurincola endophyticus]|uniref:ABC transporter permease n=1 Tax=Gynurincola endophyticus TaxID=2479004 RepID=UPI000F8DB9A1|nr:ABC transporter permease [Gynurincola endophyticus]